MTPIDFPPLARWLLAAWPDDEKRQRVVSGYQALARDYPETLADILLQASVFEESPPAATDMQAHMLTGRGQLALRILKAANADALFLFTYFDKFKPKPKE